MVLNLSAFLNIKTYIMKKLFVILTITGFMTACNNESKKEGSSTTTDTTTKVAPAEEVSPATTAVKDSVMQFKDGKVMVMVGGSWSALSAPVTTSNGRKVNPNGDVSKGTITRKMEEGMMIDKDGQMMDKDGKMMDNTGWE
jgi:hypothetical protein